MKPAVSDAPLHIYLSIVERMRIEGELGHRLWCIRHVHRTMHRRNGQAFDKRLETEPAFRPLRRCYGFAASFLTDMFHKFGYACDRLGLNIRRRRTSLNRNEAAADEGIKKFPACIPGTIPRISRALSSHHHLSGAPGIDPVRPRGERHAKPAKNA